MKGRGCRVTSSGAISAGIDAISLPLLGLLSKCSLCVTLYTHLLFNAVQLLSGIWKASQPPRLWSHPLDLRMNTLPVKKIYCFYWRWTYIDGSVAWNPKHTCLYYQPSCGEPMRLSFRTIFQCFKEPIKSAAVIFNDTSCYYPFNFT